MEGMEGTLEYEVREWGTVDGYLDFAGLGADKHGPCSAAGKVHQFMKRWQYAVVVW
jgi:hypothetical protein